MIRKAEKNDATQISPIVLQAMEEIIFKIIGKNDTKEAIFFLKSLIEQENNQYSYQNILVFEENHQILGAIIYYNGENLHKLRQKVLDFAFSTYKNEVFLEDETQKGEIYIDCIGVLKEFQGKGIGSQLLQEVKKINQGEKLGLLVDEKNPSAEKLYQKQGFIFENQIFLAGSIYRHLTFQCKKTE